MRAPNQSVLFLAVCCCVITLTAPSLQAASQALAISSRGNVAGMLWTGGQPGHPFLYHHGVLEELDPNSEWGWAGLLLPVDVNDQGQVVATGTDPGTGRVRPLLFDRGRIIDLMGSRDGGGVPVSLNERGQALILLDEISSSAFLWSNGELIDLGPASLDYVSGQYPRFAIGFDLNDHGDAILLESDHNSALVRSGVRTPLDFVATAINDRGQVIGNSVFYFAGGTSPTTRAYLWENGVRTDLGSLGGSWAFATAINDRGQIAGMSATASGEMHVFLWERGQMVDLGNPAPGAPLVVEWINGKGEVVGSTATVTTAQSWLWSRGEVVTLPPTNSPQFFAPWPRVMVDDRGRVAYNEFEGGPATFHAYFWEDGEATPLEAPTFAVERRSRPPMAAKLDSSHPSAGLVMSSERLTSGGTVLNYTVPAADHVAVEVFDVRGNRVRELVNEWQSGGSRTVSWDGTNSVGRRTSAGVYFARLRVGAESRSLKLIRCR